MWGGLGRSPGLPPFLLPCLTGCSYQCSFRGGSETRGSPAAVKSAGLAQSESETRIEQGKGACSAVGHTAGGGANCSRPFFTPENHAGGGWGDKGRAMMAEEELGSWVGWGSVVVVVWGDTVAGRVEG